VEILGRSNLKIPAHIVNGFFEASLSEITKCLREHLVFAKAAMKSKGLRTTELYVILAGEYALSPLLQTSVRECIERMNERNSVRDNLLFEIVSVRYPALAIVCGAVLFGAASAALVSHRV
jgi:hypothetical protein